MKTHRVAVSLVWLGLRFPCRAPEDDGKDVQAFVNFMRSTKAPSRGPITPDVHFGEKKFDQIGCAICHVAAIDTAAPGTPINGVAFTVPDALGNRRIHPYSDFLLHDIGTGDGIPIQQLRPTRWTRSFAIGVCRFAPLAKKIIASHISGRFGL
jgi:CxxC motif-containing protein (DUF1111 family)